MKIYISYQSFVLPLRRCPHNIIIPLKRMQLSRIRHFLSMEGSRRSEKHTSSYIPRFVHFLYSFRNPNKRNVFSLTWVEMLWGGGEVPVETEWLFGIFPSMGRLIGSTSFIFVLVTDASFVINADSFFKEDSAIGLSPTFDESSNIAISVNSNNHIMCGCVSLEYFLHVIRINRKLHSLLYFWNDKRYLEIRMAKIHTHASAICI